jgi:hypothetical protein
VAKGGDVVVGTLLSQIVYWFTPSTDGKSKTGVYRDGVAWIAKTREEWMGETGLTLEQYKRAIGVLKTKAIVEVKVMKYHGVAMSHVRLMQSITPAIQVEPNPPAAWLNTHQPGGVLPAILSTEITSETTTETTRSGVNARAGEQSDETGQKGDWEIRENQEEKGDMRKDPGIQIEQNLVSPTVGESPMNAAAILQQFHRPITSGLPAFWQSKRAVVFGGYQKPLTTKEKAQLKQLGAHLGDQTRPVIEYVLNHWTAFASRAGVSAGCSYPADPHIGFLLKHHAVAVELLQPVIVAPLLVEPPVQSVASGTESTPVHQVTSQELTDLLEGLNSP